MSNKLITTTTLRYFKTKEDELIKAYFEWLKAMVYTNNYWAQLRDEMGNPVVDENGNSILGNWSVESQKDETLEWLKAMVYTNNYWAQLRDESGNPILDENSNSILGNWSYIER